MKNILTVKNKVLIATILSFVSYFSVATASADDFKPKFGPLGNPIATPLYQDSSYLRKRRSGPDYWAISSFYEGMRGSASASAASLVMVLNALRRNQQFSSADKWVLETEMLSKSIDSESKERVSKLSESIVNEWTDRISSKTIKKPDPTNPEKEIEETQEPVGISIADLANYAQDAIQGYKLGDYRATSFKVTDAAAQESEIRDILKTNEKSAEDFIIVNYVQKSLTDDYDGGTFSPIGAYDAAKDRVLIMETDRQYYSPIWVPLKSLVAGMTPSKDGSKTYGLVWIRKSSDK
jgi:hypothetical protein